MHTDQYVITSLELHLFFGRIMKEHALFLRAGFTPADSSFANKAMFYNKEFDKVLCQAVMLGNGLVGRDVLCSGELVTEFTSLAEQQTEAFTGIPIDRQITAKEGQLQGSSCGRSVGTQMQQRVCQLNRRVLELLDGLIAFKERVLENVCRCKMFTMNYPLLLEHIIREAKHYRTYVNTLEQDGCLTVSTMRDTECFWDQIMMEHALFIRGLLDPSEAELIHTADTFAEEYARLLDVCRHAQNRTLAAGALEKTRKFRDFKIAGVKGITDCEIRSVILPLLADHVLREANHYIRLLTVS